MAYDDGHTFDQVCHKMSTTVWTDKYGHKSASQCSCELRGKKQVRRNKHPPQMGFSIFLVKARATKLHNLIWRKGTLFCFQIWFVETLASEVISTRHSHFWYADVLVLAGVSSLKRPGKKQPPTWGSPSVPRHTARTGPRGCRPRSSTCPFPCHTAPGSHRRVHDSHTLDSPLKS